MLPYSPLHHLLLDGVGRPLVMTSGNLSDEPIAHEDDDAVARLGPLTDGLLSHDRPIHIRCDDSVARTVSGRVQLLRRSRGYAPEPLTLPFDSTGVAVLAVGAELKNTVAVTKGRHVVASHHIGDLEHAATYASFLQAVDHLPALYGVVPDLVAHDLHPEYLSTKFALDLDRPLIGVQHHHAHAASCMVEHGRVEPVLAVCFDGLGYGPDGTLWGGEFLVADFAGFRRVGHLRPVVMPGGVAAIREPWRMAASWLATACGAEVAVERLTAVDRRAAAVVELAEHGHGPTRRPWGGSSTALPCCSADGRRSRSKRRRQSNWRRSPGRSRGSAVPPRYAGLVVSREDHGVIVLDPSPLLATLVADVDAGVPVPAAGRRLPRGARRGHRRSGSVARRRRSRRRRGADRWRVPERATHRGRRVDAASRQGATSWSTPRSRPTTAASASARRPSPPGGASTVPMVSQREATYCRDMSTGVATTDGG